ncbi:MAG: hypothetical protein K2O03_01405 [Lachnospiraceae bacterium]|nr:hypothetical protein [Lachnospiraceae bacterium]
MSGCVQCGRELAQNDIGAYKKFVNRGAKDSFLCRGCLARQLGIPLAQLEEKIEYFKSQGCTLFA